MLTVIVVLLVDATLVIGLGFLIGCSAHLDARIGLPPPPPPSVGLLT